MGHAVVGNAIASKADEQARSEQFRRDTKKEQKGQMIRQSTIETKLVLPWRFS